MRELSLHVLDVLENALEAGATAVSLCIEEDLGADRLGIVVSDNGRGMDSEALGRALDPFYTTRTTRHVGLGLPLLAAAAERSAGQLCVDSALGIGTTISASFQRSHLDRAPLGNMTDTLMAFLLGVGDRVRFQYTHHINGSRFEFDTATIQEQLGEVQLSHPAVREWLRDYIAEGEAEVACQLTRT